MFTKKPLPFSGGFGAEVSNLTRDDLANPGIRKALYDLWIQEGLIVFRGLEGPETQIALSEVFGPSIAHPVKSTDTSSSLNKFRELATIRYDPQTGDIYEVDGVELGAWLPWHSDLVYVDKINRGGVLRAVVVPERGGETGFMDKIRSYETLPADLKQQIEGLFVLYKFELDVARRKFGAKQKAKVVQWSENRKGIQSQTPDFPTVMHPMTYTQRETGRKVLNVSPWFALGIHGMENEAGDALLHRVVDHMSDERNAYYHRWGPTDMVLWDNWRMLHCGKGTPRNCTRWMQRTVIDGDYAFGRLLNQATEVEDRHRVDV
jgi:taurine dioxygenase